MTDGNALLQAIIANPDDNDPRLQYADWCQENGRQHRGEFISQQIEFSRGLRDSIDPHLIPSGLGLPGVIGAARPQKSYLKGSLLRREYREDYAFTWGRGFLIRLEMPLSAFTGQAGSFFRTHPVTSVLLTDANPEPSASEDLGYGWVNAHALRLSLPGADLFHLSHALPNSIWELLPDSDPLSNDLWRYYPSVKSALDAVSRACCLWARARADEVSTTL